jgi:hypothetical protein
MRAEVDPLRWTLDSGVRPEEGVPNGSPVELVEELAVAERDDSL